MPLKKRWARPAWNRLCTSSATVVMDEDDYHRIKGLLGKWPHAASRSIEKRNGASGGEASSKTFRVVLPADGDTSARLMPWQPRL